MRDRHCLLVLLAPLLLTLGACGKGTAPGKSVAADQVAATINGEAISKTEFDAHLANVARQSGRDVTEEQKADALDQLISMKLAAADGEKAGIASEDKIVHQIELARANIVADAAFQKYIADHPVTEEELRPEYDSQVAQLPREYHARHILVVDKGAAEGIIKDLKGGADFAKVATQKSKDSSSESGGDLGWFTLDKMVKPFSDALAKLQPGQLTEQPVETQYGWHVIRLEESRVQSVPPFEDVKDNVKVFVQRKRLQTYLEDLRKAAKIEKKI
jgi:peptidyl-prolyl cis-trans isomerase C